MEITEELLEQINREIVDSQFKKRGNTLRKQHEMIKSKIFMLLVEKEILEFEDINSLLTQDLLDELLLSTMLYRHRELMDKLKKPSP
jgi:hypothetical protein